MKTTSPSIAKYILSFILIFVLLGESVFAVSIGEGKISDEQQRNAIAMLNYITVLTQEINSSKNSRLYLEDVYSSIFNNILPDSVDKRTENQLDGLLDTIKGYRMIAVKRDRLKLIYNQNKAQAIREAVPNPLGLLSTVQSYRPSKIALSFIYMAVDAKDSYDSYNTETDLQYLKDGWELDDKESAYLDESRENALFYMIDLVREYKIPNNQTLTEDTIQEFVDCKNNPNVVSSIQFLESNKKTYQHYGGYWLLLAESYYKNHNYQSVLDAIKQYEELQYHIFRRDYELARVLPLAISAAENIYEGNKYVESAKHYTQLIIDNIKNDDWALWYYAAQVYIDLYQQTKDESYLWLAYNIVKDNVNNLFREQYSLNEAFFKPIPNVPKKASKDEKKQLEANRKNLLEIRKTELPPVYEPLLLNCELLYALSNELNLSEDELIKINSLVHQKDSPTFLIPLLENRYTFSGETEPIDTNNIYIDYCGDRITLPANCVTKDAAITVTAYKNGKQLEVFDNWEVTNVTRKTEGDISTYSVVYTSKEADDFPWEPDLNVCIDIVPVSGMDIAPIHFEYNTYLTDNIIHRAARFMDLCTKFERVK